MSVAKGYLLDIVGQLYMWIRSAQDCIYKSWTRWSSHNPLRDGGGVHEVLLLTEKLLGTDARSWRISTVVLVISNSESRVLLFFVLTYLSPGNYKDIQFACSIFFSKTPIKLSLISLPSLFLNVSTKVSTHKRYPYSNRVVPLFDFWEAYILISIIGGLIDIPKNNP